MESQITKPIIVVTVQGGLVVDVNTDQEVIVVIQDYDIEGVLYDAVTGDSEEELQTDEEGVQYREHVYVFSHGSCDIHGKD